MTVLEAVKCSHTPAFMSKAAIAVAQDALIAPETVVWAHAGNVQLNANPDNTNAITKTGVTVITTHRLLFASCTMGNRLTHSIVLSDITDIRITCENALEYLNIHSLESHISIQGYSTSIKELNAALADAIDKSAAIDPTELADFRSALDAQPTTPTEKANQGAKTHPRWDTVLQAVKCCYFPIFINKKAVAVAQDALIPPETILWAHTGNVQLNAGPDNAKTVTRSGATVITTHRLLFASGSPSDWLIRSIILSDITDIRITCEKSLKYLHIHSAENYFSCLFGEKTANNIHTTLTNAIDKYATFDPTELADFRSALDAQAATPEEKIDPEPYFQKHYPDTDQATKEMHQDTGVVRWKCRAIVDAYFAANISRAPKRKHIFPHLMPLSPEQQDALDKRIEDLEQQGIAYCPRCASVSISIQKRGFFSAQGTSYYTMRSGLFQLLYRAIRANERVCFCMKCGHTWQP